MKLQNPPSMGFLAKLESITCKRTASLFAIIDSPNVSYKRVQGRGGGRIFQRCIGEPFAKKIWRATIKILIRNINIGITCSKVINVRITEFTYLLLLRCYWLKKMMKNVSKKLTLIRR